MIIRRIRSLFLKNNEKKIAILEPDIYPALEKIRNGFIDALEKDSPFLCSIQTYNALGDLELLHNQVENIAQKTYDLILSIGPLCTLSARNNATLLEKKTPLLFTDVYDPLSLNLISCCTNQLQHICGITSFSHDYIRRIEHLHMLQPHLQRLLIIHDASPFHFLEHDKQSLLALLTSLMIQGSFLPINHKDYLRQKVIDTLRVWRPDVIMTLRDSTMMAGIQDLIFISERYRIPLYTSDLESVNLGATFGCGESEYHLGFRAGEQARRILTQADSLPTSGMELYHQSYQVRINKAAMRLQGLKLSEHAYSWLFKNGGEVET